MSKRVMTVMTVITLVLAACGGGGSPAPSGPASLVPSETGGSTETAEPGTETSEPTASADPGQATPDAVSGEPCGPNAAWVACDPTGGIWLAGYDVVAHYDGANLQTFETSNLGTGEYVKMVNDVAVAPDGTAWFITASGVAAYDGQAWRHWENGDGFKEEMYPEKVVVNAKGQPWVALATWGVITLVGDTDDEIFSLAVAGEGPRLPAKQEKSPGTLTGRIVKNGDPLAGRSVQACVEFVGMTFIGDTPCEDQAFFRTVKTGSDGSFVFADLPVSKYALTFQNEDGKWLRLTDGYKIGDRESTVAEDETTDLGDLDIAELSD